MKRLRSYKLVSASVLALSASLTLIAGPSFAQTSSPAAASVDEGSGQSQGQDNEWVSAPVARFPSGEVDTPTSLARIRAAYIDAGWYAGGEAELTLALESHRQTLEAYRASAAQDTTAIEDVPQSAELAGCNYSYIANWGRSTILGVVRIFVAFGVEVVFSCGGAAVSVCHVGSAVVGSPPYSGGTGLGSGFNGCFADTLLPQAGPRPTPAVLTFSVIASDRTYGFRPRTITIN